MFYLGKNYFKTLSPVFYSKSPTSTLTKLQNPLVMN